MLTNVLLKHTALRKAMGFNLKNSFLTYMAFIEKAACGISAAQSHQPNIGKLAAKHVRLPDRAIKKESFA